MSRLFQRFAPLFATICAAWIGPAWAHGDHDAGRPSVTSAAPRLESVGTGMELVAVADGHRLIL